MDISFLLLIIGFLVLIKFAEILVDSASKLAKIFGIPSFIVGFSVIAFGTSAPELAIGIISGVHKNNLITLGNVIGGSIVNVALIIGIMALIHPLKIEKSVLYKEIPLSFGVQLLLFTMLIIGGALSRIDAVILLILFGVFLTYIFNHSKELGIANKNNESRTEAATGNSKIKLAGLLLAGIIGITIGGNIVVNSSTTIARMFGMSDVLIGITVVSIGTSLPELITSVVATLKKQSDIAIGNIIGSNIFNILLVLGASSLINPIPKTEGIEADIFAMLCVTMLAFFVPLRRKAVSKLGGTVFLTFYVLFLLYKVSGLYLIK